MPGFPAPGNQFRRALFGRQDRRNWRGRTTSRVARGSVRRWWRLRWWLPPLAVGGIGLEVALGFLWADAPDLYAATTAGDGRAQAIALTRTGILTVGAGLIALAAAVANLLESRRATNLTHEREREGQVTERYTAAVGQLGSETLDVRLGGIYALERIAVDSAADHRTVVEVLSAFVREHTIPGRAGTLRRDRRPPTLPTPAERAASAPATGPNAVGLDTDIQAALTVLGRLPSRKLIARGDLTGAQLVGAQLVGAKLTGAELIGANLTGAILFGADLTRAEMLGAKLTGAELIEADLTGANLDRADLTSAEMSQADLAGAHLEKADLTGVEGLWTDQVAAAEGDEFTRLPAGVARPKWWPPPAVLPEDD